MNAPLQSRTLLETRGASRHHGAARALDDVVLTRPRCELLSDPVQTGNAHRDGVAQATEAAGLTVEFQISDWKESRGYHTTLNFLQSNPADNVGGFM